MAGGRRLALLLGLLAAWPPCFATGSAAGGCKNALPPSPSLLRLDASSQSPGVTRTFVASSALFGIALPHEPEGPGLPLAVAQPLDACSPIAVRTPAGCRWHQNRIKQK